MPPLLEMFAVGAALQAEKDAGSVDATPAPDRSAVVGPARAKPTSAALPV